MDPQLLEEKLTKAVDAAMRELVEEKVGRRVDRIEQMVAQLRAQENGGVAPEHKEALVEAAKVIAGVKTKANEALVGDVDARGGYLVPQEVADTILRTAKTAGVVAALAQRWSVKRDSTAIPTYSGGVVEGEFIGQDQESAVSALTYGQTILEVKKWALNFAVSRDLIADADIDLADWLVALAAEGLANRIDKEGLVGSTFTGVLNDTNVSVVSMGAGKTSFTDASVDDLLDLEAVVGEDYRDGAYVMSYSVWNFFRKLKDGNGQYLVAINQDVIRQNNNAQGIQPVGHVNGKPVYTCRYMPSLSASAADTKFVIYGAFNPGLAYGVNREMETFTFTSGNFSGEIARKDQVAYAFRARVGTKVALPSAFAVLKTAAA